MRTEALLAVQLLVASVTGAAAQTPPKPVDAGDFRVVAVDRTFNYQRGSTSGTLEFQRDGRLVYRVRSGATHRNDLDGRWEFTGNTLCLKITTIDDGVPECAELFASGPDDFETATGSYIFR